MRSSKTLALLLTLLLTLAPLASALAEGEDTECPVTIDISEYTPEDQRTQEKNVGNIITDIDSGSAPAAQVGVSGSGQGTLRAEDVSQTMTGWGHAVAVQVDAQGQGAQATVEAEEVSAASEYSSARGVVMCASGAGAEASVTVENVTATSEELDGFAMVIWAQNGGAAQVQVTGQEGVRVQGKVPAFGVDATARGADARATVEVTGDIVSAAEDSPEGVLLSVIEGGQVQLTCGGDVVAQGWEPIGIEMICTSSEGAEEVAATAALTVTGSVTAEGERGTGVKAVTVDLAAATVTVGGDVTGTATGFTADMRGEGGAVDVLVAGTLSGGDQAILASGAAANEGLTVTAWKLEGDTLVQAQNGASAETIENNIQYIIQTEQPAAGGTFALGGTADYRDLQVAHAGDRVAVLPTLEEGYTLLGAYNNGVALLLNDEGNYYLVVPQGGGVLLTVEVESLPPLAPPPVRVTGTASSADGAASMILCSNHVLHLMAGEENIRGYFYSYEGGLCFRVGAEDAAYTEHADGSGTLTAAGLTFELSPELVLALKVVCYS